MRLSPRILAVSVAAALVLAAAPAAALSPLPAQELVVEVAYEGASTVVCASADWTPEFVIEQLSSAEEVCNTDADDYSDGYPRYVWAWIDEARGIVRARAFVDEVGIEEDEATGSAAILLAAHLNRALRIHQGVGSRIDVGPTHTGKVALSGDVKLDR